MEIIDNVNKTLKEDLTTEIHKGSKVSIAAACFSIYAFAELKKELKNIEELRFIFTSPTFIKEKAKREKREFYIPRQEREKNLFGSEFEVKLRNEMTQKAIAKECADWIRKKAVFKSNVTNEIMTGFINVDDKSYMTLNGFTTVDLGCERGNNAYYIINKLDAPVSNAYLQLFEQIWNDESKLQEVTDEVIENVTTVYNENSPDYLYFVTLYNIFNEFLEDVSEDVLPNEATGFKESKIWGMLYNFQKDAALAIINKLEKYNGCILADSVGLGKTFTALSVIKYYENRNKSVLVLCPKKLANNWNTYKYNYINNPIAADRMRYDVLFHTDLSRDSGNSNGMNLDMVNWGNYDLVVIDESHNFRNGGKISGEDEKENRYLKLLNKVIRKGVKTKVLMLSATPVNNRFVDLKNQIALAYEGESRLLDEKLSTHKSIDDIFKQAQTAFNTWSKWEPEDRTTSKLLRMLDFDFFELLDSVTIARSRKHIQKYYDTSDIGTFPKRNPPISKRPGLTDLSKAINYNEIFEQLNMLRLCIYTPTDYILPSKLAKYKDVYDSNHVKGGLTQSGREQGIRSFRMDEQGVGKSLVHKINKLTVIASESYKDFVTDLQKQIKTDLYDRPRKATVDYFTGKTVMVNGNAEKLGKQQATMVYQYLIKNDYVTMDGNDNITEKYHIDLENNNLASLPEHLVTYTEGIHKLIQSVFSDKILEDMIDNGNETKVPSNDLNDNFYKKEFQTLWGYINHKYAYTVSFDSEELIKKAIASIDSELYVSMLQYTTSVSEQKDTLSADAIKSGDSFKGAKSDTTALRHFETSQIKYDLVGKVAEATVLTRRTVAAILKGIHKDKFDMYKNNPEEFISKVTRLIKEQKATMIVDHISYDQLEGKYESDIFTAEKHTTIDKAFKAEKHIQPYVFTDGNADKSVERKFAEDLDGAAEVCVYAKLPKGFSIPTPVGNYSPDWAIAFNEGTVKHIFFVAETKGTMESLQLRPIEKAKIMCARRLFNEISTDNVVYHDVDSYQSLLNIMPTIEKKIEHK